MIAGWPNSIRLDVMLKAPMAAAKAFPIFAQVIQGYLGSTLLLY
jgi:hypothetical protein